MSKGFNSKDLEMISECIKTQTIWIINNNEKIEKVLKELAEIKEYQAFNHTTIHKRFDGLGRFLKKLESTLIGLS